MIRTWPSGQPRKPKIRKLIADPRNDVFVSVVSIWEIGIKTSGGATKRMPFSGAAAGRAFEQLGFNLLPVLPAHASAFADFAVAHADPFDRMILTQAITDQLRLVTVDARLATYSESVMTW